MTGQRLVRFLGGRRFSTASHGIEAVRAVVGGRRWAAVRFLALAAVTWRWRAAGMAFELAWRLLRRWR